MAGWILSLLAAAGSFFGGLISKLKGGKDATAQTLQGQNATVQSQLDQERDANAELVTALDADHTAAARSLHDDPHANDVDTDRADPINLGDDGKPDPDIRN